MFITYTKAQARKAMALTFDADFVDPDFRNINVSLEFPVKEQDYPAIWIEFEPLGSLSLVGIGHSEYVSSGPEMAREMYRWRFAGHLSFTAVAMTSLERDRLVDHLVRVFAFSRMDTMKIFRETIEGGELIALNIDFDQVELRGFSTSPGTPWGTDEMVYEGTVAMEVAGEFVSTDTVDLVFLSQIETFNWVYTFQNDPTTGSNWLG